MWAKMRGISEDQAMGLRGGEPEVSKIEKRAHQLRISDIFLGSEYGTVILLCVLIVVLWLIGFSAFPGFLSGTNLAGVSLILTPIVFAAFAEYFVILIGEIDISIGGIMGLVLVAISFFSGANWIVMLLMATAIGVAAAIINAYLIVKGNADSVIATIAMLSVYEGIGLVFRPNTAGAVSSSVVGTINASVGHITYWTMAALVVAIVGDIWVRRSGRGLAMRSVGFDRARALRLGVEVSRVRFLAFGLGGAFAGIAGFLLAGVTGTGDATAGESYVLIAIAVPVIGGAALRGGRGTLVGCLIGGVVLASVQSLVTFASLPSGYYLVATGLLTIFALALGVVRARRRKNAAV